MFSENIPLGTNNLSILLVQAFFAKNTLLSKIVSLLKAVV